MPKTFKIGVIGTGAIAQACHIPGYLAAKNCKIVAVADPEPRSIQQCRDLGYDIGTAYSDYKDMLQKETLDVVSICTPNAFHKAATIAAANKGCDILLEKPVTLTLAEARAVDKAVQKNGVRLMTGFTHRFNDLNVAARKALQAGKIGKPYMIRIRFAHGGPQPGWAKTEWFYNPEIAGGGALLDMGIHGIDLAQWYIGPITSVQATIRTLRKSIAVDDNAVCNFEFGNSCLGQMDVGWTSPSGFVGVELMGNDGSIVVDYMQNKAIMRAGSCKPDGTRNIKETILCENPPMGPWQREMEYFTAALGKKAAFTPDFAPGISSLAVALAAYKSSKTGKQVNLSAT